MSVTKQSGEGKPSTRTERERALLTAAGRLFATQGYEATTTRQIAAEAGCAEGLISRYFRGKAGLLEALIHNHVSEGASDLEAGLPPAETIEAEILRLTAWEVEHIWGEREFLRVVIPRRILDPSWGQESVSIPLRRSKVIMERLRKYEKGRSLSEHQLKAVADAILGLGLIFGFIRPISFKEPPEASKQTAMTVANFLVKGL